MFVIICFALFCVHLASSLSANVTTNSLTKMQQSGNQGYLITAGGYNDVGARFTNKCYAYDIDAGSWIPLLDLPNAQMFPLVAHEGRVYGIGGLVAYVATRTVIKLSTSQKKWIEGPPLQVANGEGSNALTLNGSLFELGGSASESDVETYSCGTGDFVWNTVAPTLQPHVYSGAAVLNGKIYVCGTSATASTFCECYDPALNKWKPIKPMNEARIALAMVVLKGYLYVIGGAETNNERYDPGRDEWTFFSAAPNSLYMHAAVTDGSKIYVIGGRNNAAALVVYNSLFAYIPELDIWQSYVNYPLAMRSIGATFVKQLPS